MKAAEVRKLNKDEITVEAARLRRRLFDLRCQTVTEKIEDTSQFRKTRKDLARVLTEINTRKATSTATERAATGRGGKS
jgi:large subunit ribosomal protein L29